MPTCAEFDPTIIFAADISHKLGNVALWSVA